MPTKETKKHNWAAIRHDYVTSRDSLQEVARRHGVDHTAVRHHSSAEDWGLERERHQRNVADKRLELAAKAQAKTEAEIDTAIHTAAWASVSMLTESLANAKTPATADRALTALEKAYRMLRLTGNLPLEKVPRRPEQSVTIFHGIDSGGQDYFEVASGTRYYPLEAAAAAAARLRISLEKPPEASSAEAANTGGEAGDDTAEDASVAEHPWR